MSRGKAAVIERRRWTEPELRLLRSMYPECHTQDVAAWLARPIYSVYHAANTRGLRKSAQYLTSEAAARIRRGKQHPKMIATRFRKGQLPWTTGLRGLTGVQDGCRATQFEKGRPAHEARNYKPIGSLRITDDGILERKVTDDPSFYTAKRWVSVARLVWQDAFGPIPSGHMVRFKPGMATTDAQQITPERLECISRLENMCRNSLHTLYPPELARLVQLRGALNRQIGKRARALEQP